MTTKHKRNEQPTPATPAEPTALVVPTNTAKQQRVLRHMRAANAPAEAIALVAALVPEKATKASTPKEPRPTCSATKKDGTACSAHAMAGHDVCCDHRPGVARLTEDEHQFLLDWLKDATVADLTGLIGWHRAKSLVAELTAAQAA